MGAVAGDRGRLGIRARRRGGPGEQSGRRVWHGHRGCSFSGFRPGKQIYAHYLHRGKITATAKFGRSKGACGQLKSKAKFYPGRQRFTTYKVQFDDARKYSPHSSPRFVTTLRLFRL